MNEVQFQRLVRLSRRTGSPLVVFDADGDGSVLLSLERYEALVPEARSVVKTTPAPIAPPVVPLAHEPQPISRESAPLSADLPEEPMEPETQFYLEPVE